MNYNLKAGLLLPALFLFIATTQLQAQDTLKVVYYNILNYPGSTPERVSHFHTLVSYIQPDVLLVNELLNDSGSQNLLDNALNYGGGSTYASALFIDGFDSDNQLFYNQEKLALFAQDTIETALRVISEYVLYPTQNGTLTSNDTTFLTFYSAHLKASTGTTNKLKRLEEVLRFKQHLSQKPEVKNIIWGGDMNFYTNTEPAYLELVNGNDFLLHDVLPAGSWHDNDNYAAIHTQSTRTAQFGGGASGGLDDRFDFILFSGDILNGTEKATYLPGSMHAFGNDANHFNNSLLDLPLHPDLPDAVIQALYYMSDHLPVLCDLVVERQQSPSLALNIKVLLEGPYAGAEMNTSLKDIYDFPLQQPYNAMPWQYAGNELLTIIPPDLVDWVLVNVFKGTLDGGSLSYTSLLEEACLLLKDGKVVNATDQLLPTIEPENTDSLYLLIRHRNHLPALAVFPAAFSNDTLSYDFSSSSLQTLGGTDAVSEVAPDVWGMTAGDVNADGQVTIDDLLLWKASAGKNDYRNADCNFDGQVDNVDKNKIISKNL